MFLSLVRRLGRQLRLLGVPPQLLGGLPVKRGPLPLVNQGFVFIEDTLQEKESEPAVPAVEAAAGADTVAPSFTRGGSSERPARVRICCLPEGEGKGVEVFHPDWGITTDDSVEEAGVARDVLSLPLAQDTDRLGSLPDEKFEKKILSGWCQGAHSKVVEKSGQKIVALLKEIEQMKAEVEWLKAAVDFELKVEAKAVEAKAEVARLLGELSSVQVALSTKTMSREATITRFKENYDGAKWALWTSNEIMTGMALAIHDFVLQKVLGFNFSDCSIRTSMVQKASKMQKKKDHKAHEKAECKARATGTLLLAPPDGQKGSSSSPHPIEPTKTPPPPQNE
ncbi:hypothetical protein NE237_016755 [Protea cynaroides]|uniref:Uncharacterized protein n=1 Tax=Protea cynaroides TaxID=273540 RepID=A0A9Q0K6G3_9MAGN|nr:hypothetical protein NE237_016755 [Protea cynaroides]